MTHHRAWGVLLILTLSLSIALPSAVATHNVPGPDPPVQPPHTLPNPDLPVDPPGTSGDTDDLTEGMEDCVQTVLGTFLDAVTGLHPLTWFRPEEPYCEEKGDEIKGTVQGVEDEVMGLASELEP